MSGSRDDGGVGRGAPGCDVADDARSAVSPPPEPVMGLRAQPTLGCETRGRRRLATVG